MRVILLAAAFLHVLTGAAGAAAPPAAGAIAEAQRELRRHGYEVGPANGVITEKTEQALRAYRQAAGAQAALPPALQAAGDAVAKAQQRLARLGYLKAPADGAIGPQTRDAIIRFEAKERLPLDPRVSDRLLAALDQAGAPAAQPPAATPPAAGQPPSTPAPAPSAPGRQPLPPGVTPPPIR